MKKIAPAMQTACNGALHCPHLRTVDTNSNIFISRPVVAKMLVYGRPPPWQNDGLKIKLDSNTFAHPQHAHSQLPAARLGRRKPGECANRQQGWRHVLRVRRAADETISRRAAVAGAADLRWPAGRRRHAASHGRVECAHCHCRWGLTFTPSYALFNTTKSSGGSLTCKRPQPEGWDADDDIQWMRECELCQ